MILESQQKTSELAFGSATKGNSALTAEEKLDQEDQRIKIVDLGTLEELTEGNAAIAC